jgi:Apea-like HEPN
MTRHKVAPGRARVKIAESHPRFFAPLWNITSCVRRIPFPVPFSVETWRPRALFRYLEGMDLELAMILDSEFHEYKDPERPQTMYLAVADGTVPPEFAAASTHGGARAFSYHEHLAEKLDQHLSLLHLFDRGDVFVPLWFVVSNERKGPFVETIVRSYAQHSGPAYDIGGFLMPELRRFLEEVSLPLKPDYIDLAFRYLENSYTVPDMRLRFLSLMIALEILLNADRGELRYRVSRNLAVLIGRDEAHAANVFKEAKALYDVRSKLVHTGHDVDLTGDSVRDLETLVRGALLRLSRMGLEKDDLLARLNASGFGVFGRTATRHARSGAQTVLAKGER